MIACVVTLDDRAYPLIYDEAYNLRWYENVFGNFVNVKNEGVAYDDYKDIKLLETTDAVYITEDGSEYDKFELAIWDIERDFQVVTAIYGYRVFEGIAYNLEEIVKSKAFHEWADQNGLSVWCGFDEFDKVYRYRQLSWQINSLNDNVEQLQNNLNQQNYDQQQHEVNDENAEENQEKESSNKNKNNDNDE